jgi:hypothetical protein
VSYESNVLALDNEFLSDERLQGRIGSFGIHSLNFTIDSGMLLGSKLGDSRGENEVLLIDGDLTVSF